MPAAIAFAPRIALFIAGGPANDTCRIGPVGIGRMFLLLILSASVIFAMLPVSFSG
ncbi:hypothetical protein [Palleronia sp.]|uniref:hypothetical protein n=1 Tax=Palleronia sp. TaxID=1940284 RepID=UPI0035C85A9F